MTEWPDGLVLALEIGLIVYALFVAVTIVLERRRPTATIAWILSLVLLPGLGLLAYVFIGRRKARVSRRRARRQRELARESTETLARLEHSPAELEPRAAGLVRLALQRGAAPVRRAEAVDILPHPAEVFAAIEAAIQAARYRIHLEFYIWRDDDTGRKLIELLSERAAAGVEVRLLYDEIGSISTPRRHFAPLREAGGSVAAFAPLRLRLRLPRGRIDFRNHRKVVCIDGEVGFVGGINVGNEYRGVTAHGRVWNDLFVRIRGDAILGLEAMFLDDWASATREQVALASGLPASSSIQAARSTLAERRSNTGGPLVQIVPSGPNIAPSGREHNASVIAETFLAAIGTSMERVWVVTPYFIPDAALNSTLQTAALRGVDVKIIVPNLSDNDLRFVALAARSYYDDLLEAGCKIYEYAPGMNHAKYMIIDDTVAVIGSANMDVRSLYLNYEVTAIVYDDDVTAELAEAFREDLADTETVGVEQRREVPLGERFAEGLVRLLSPLL